MVKKGFPSFGMSQAGAYVTALKNYNLPDFILKLVAKDTNSELLERGRIDDRLQSMNDDALELLNRVFVDCEEDKKGKFTQYRFFAYVSSMYHKCEVMINETIPGKSGQNHKVPVAVKSNGMYIAIAFNKPIGNAVNKKNVTKFYGISDAIQNGVHGTKFTNAIYCSSVSFTVHALVHFAHLITSRNPDPDNNI